MKHLSRVLVLIAPPLLTAALCILAAGKPEYATAACILVGAIGSTVYVGFMCVLIALSAERRRR